MRGSVSAISWIFLAIVAVALTGAPSAAAGPPCAGASSSADAGVRQAKRAVMCLSNVERRRHHLSQMRLSPELSAVAQAHARDMVERHYFSHFSPGGKDQMDRIAASGYPPTTAGACWTAGENLLDSYGAASPQLMFRAWMHSAEHRAVILQGGWRDFGLGIVRGSPTGEPNGVTVVALYAVRSKALCG